MDDEPQVRRGLARLLLDRGVEALTAESGAAALALLATTSVDVMLVDLSMPGASCVDVIGRAKQARPDVEIIVMAALADVDLIPSALQAGAFGFVNKPPILDDEIASLVARAAEKRELIKRARSLEERLGERETLGEIIGQSRRFREALRVAAAAAGARSPVLILGEPGVGKELFARAIHRQGGHAAGRFILVDCGAMSTELLEIELFGAPRRGSGDAGTPHPTVNDGIFERAGEGTVLLDSVGEMSLTAQARLVQVLSSALPSSLPSARAGSARVIAASTPDLRERVADGRFREDLFYRLASLLIEIPPLRQRRDDIPLLAYHFIDKHAAGAHGGRAKTISVEAMRELRERAWPGNVRELSSAIERAALMARGDAIFPADLPAPASSVGDIAAPRGRSPSADLAEMPYPDAKARVVDAFERDYVERVLEGAGGNVSEAARRAGMDRSNFRRLVRKAREGRKQTRGS